MSKYTTVGLMLLSAALITFWSGVQHNIVQMHILSSILTFLSGFMIGGGVGLKEGGLEKEYKNK
jgi:hypothetical protein